VKKTRLRRVPSGYGNHRAGEGRESTKRRGGGEQTEGNQTVSSSKARGETTARSWIITSGAIARPCKKCARPAGGISRNEEGGGGGGETKIKGVFVSFVKNRGARRRGLVSLPVPSQKDQFCERGKGVVFDAGGEGGGMSGLVFSFSLDGSGSKIEKEKL